MTTIALSHSTKLLFNRTRGCVIGFPKNHNFPTNSYIVSTYGFATMFSPERPRPGPNSGKFPLQRPKLHRQKQNRNDGHLGYGANIDKPARRWRGGRYNYFDWNTLKECICNCPSAIERDRMPSAGELNYMYRGASIGVKHHGGFAVVAQLLNLSPLRPWVTPLEEFPTWIEDEQIDKKLREYSARDAYLSANNNRFWIPRAPSPPHRRELPPYLKNIFQNVDNIQGRPLSRTDKRRMIRLIYARINKRFYEEDKRKREEIQSEWQIYKQWIRDQKIIEEVEQGFLDETDYGYLNEDKKDETISHVYRKKPKESDQKSFTKKYMSAKHKHILLEHSTHLASEEAKFYTKKPTGVRGTLSSIREKIKLPSLGRKKQKVAASKST